MKIGILTFFCGPNYGAMLQSFSLWHYLEDRGHEVEFIDYPLGGTRRGPLWRCFINRRGLNEFGIIKNKLKNYVRFSIARFSESFPKSCMISSFKGLADISKQYDCVVVGSDQVWNPAWCTPQSLPILMLDFVNKGTKRISYAASFGTSVWRIDQNAGMAAMFLRRFDAISVREKSGVRVVRDLCGRSDAKWLLDPTLLHVAQFYLGIASQRKYTEPYICSYILDEWSDDATIERLLKRVKKMCGISIVRTDRTNVAGLLSPICRYFNVETKIPVADWLSLIANSGFVVTNSFHGTVFSILFHKPFVTVLLKGSNSGMNERVVSLLQLLNLENRMVEADEQALSEDIVSGVIPWDDIDDRLVKRRIDTDLFFSEMGL